MSRTWNRRKIVQPLPVRLAARDRWQAMKQRRELQGLTSRGTRPKRRDFKPALINNIDRLALRLKNLFPFVPPNVQTDLIEFGRELAALRKRI